MVERVGVGNFVIRVLDTKAKVVSVDLWPTWRSFTDAIKVSGGKRCKVCAELEEGGKYGRQVVGGSGNELWDWIVEGIS